jgi:hypothetical protein
MLLNSIIREDKKHKKEMSLFVVPEKEDLFPQQKTGYNAWLMPKGMACPALTKKRPTPLLGVGPRTLGEMPISS